MLAAFAAVDYVVIFDEPTPRELIAALLPDVLAKGADWGAGEIVGREEVEAAGGHVVQIPLEPGYSTSEILRTIRAPAERDRRGRAVMLFSGCHRDPCARGACPRRRATLESLRRGARNHWWIDGFCEGAFCGVRRQRVPPPFSLVVESEHRAEETLEPLEFFLRALGARRQPSPCSPLLTCCPMEVRGRIRTFWRRALRRYGGLLPGRPPSW